MSFVCLGSFSEQNSLDMAWELLMEDRFLELRKFIFGTKQELLRFRQIIVNIVCKFIYRFGVRVLYIESSSD